MYTLAHIYLIFFFFEHQLRDSVVSSYRLIHVVWADQPSVSPRGEMTLSAVFLSFLFCVGRFGEND